MSDEPNGKPPGQNNLDAGVERYVDKKYDPSASQFGRSEEEEAKMAEGKPLETEGVKPPEPSEDDPSNNPAEQKEEPKQQPQPEPKSSARK